MGTERTNLEAETADAHAGYNPGRDPIFWLWAGWCDRGRLPSERPAKVPFRIAKWKLAKWEARYRIHRGAKRPPAPSPFGGIGLFTGWDPGVILRKRPAVDWVAVTADEFRDEQGRFYPGCTSTMAAQLRIAGYRLHAWESRMTHGVGVAYELSAEGYIGQAESEAELEKCLSLATVRGRPRALVGNPGAWHDGTGDADTQAKQVAANIERARAAGWELILEHYRNEQPGLQPDSRGYPVASFCFGLYPVNGARVPLGSYLAELPGVSWSGYLAEEMSDDDYELIGRKP